MNQNSFAVHVTVRDSANHNTMHHNTIYSYLYLNNYTYYLMPITYTLVLDCTFISLKFKSSSSSSSYRRQTDRQPTSRVLFRFIIKLKVYYYSVGESPPNHDHPLYCFTEAESHLWLSQSPVTNVEHWYLSSR